MKPNCSSYLLSLLLIACLLAEGSPAATLTYTYDNKATSLFKLVTFPLGTVLMDHTIVVNVTLWNSLTSTFILTLQNALTQASLATATCTSKNTCSVSFYTIATSLAYEINVAPSAAMSTSQIYPFYLVGKSYYGNSTYAGNPTEQVLVRTGDVLRNDYIGRLIYF
jgi:hypothetical protein